MKKNIFAIITSILICGNLTACSEQSPIIGQQGAPNSVTDSVPNSLDDTSSTENESGADSSGNGSTESEPVEEVRGIYGEMEIPDVKWKDQNIRNVFERNAMLLDSIVFETHESGDYKFSLVGENVWVDKERSTDKIYADNLVIEVEKNGVKLNSLGTASYMHEVVLHPPYGSCTVLEDKIGSYLDMYEMDVPVIVMKYYFDYDIPGAVDRLMMFATVQENEVHSHFGGIYGEGTRPFSVYVQSGTSYYTMDSGEPVPFLHPFGDGKFKVADGKTLIDEEEGIKYTFDFSDPMSDERYTAEKIV